MEDCSTERNNPLSVYVLVHWRTSHHKQAREDECVKM